MVQFEPTKRQWIFMMEMRMEICVRNKAAANTQRGESSASRVMHVRGTSATRTNGAENEHERTRVAHATPEGGGVYARGGWCVSHARVACLSRARHTRVAGV